MRNIEIEKIHALEASIGVQRVSNNTRLACGFATCPYMDIYTYIYIKWDPLPSDELLQFEFVRVANRIYQWPARLCVSVYMFVLKLIKESL